MISHQYEKLLLTKYAILFVACASAGVIFSVETIQLIGKWQFSLVEPLTVSSFAWLTARLSPCCIGAIGSFNVALKSLRALTDLWDRRRYDDRVKNAMDFADSIDDPSIRNLTKAQIAFHSTASFSRDSHIAVGLDQSGILAAFLDDRIPRLHRIEKRR